MEVTKWLKPSGTLPCKNPGSMAPDQLFGLQERQPVLATAWLAWDLRLGGRETSAYSGELVSVRVSHIRRVEVVAVLWPKCWLAFRCAPHAERCVVERLNGGPAFGPEGHHRSIANRCCVAVERSADPKCKPMRTVGALGSPARPASRAFRAGPGKPSQPQRRQRCVIERSGM